MVDSRFGAWLGLASGRFRDQAFEFFIADLTRNGVADFFESREIPQVWKVAALLRLHGLNRAVFAIEKDTFAVGLILQRQSLTIMAQLQKLLNKIELAHLLERGEPGNFLLGQTHLTRPAATGRATLTFIKNRHTAP